MAVVLWSGSGGGGERRDPRPSFGTGEQDESARLRVLVVDDDRSILATVHDILTAEGCDVATAAGGREAIELVRTWHPALMLLDMRMPVVDGWAVARAVRQMAIGLPIVVMTAAENAERWASEIDADGYIAKPFHLNELLDFVDRYRGGGKPN